MRKYFWNLFIVVSFLFVFTVFQSLNTAEAYCDPDLWHDATSCQSSCTKTQFNDCDVTNTRVVSCTGGSCTAPTATPGGNPNVRCGSCSCPDGSTKARWCTPNCSATNACWCDPCGGGGGGGGSGCCTLDSECTANNSCYNCSPGNCAGSCDSNDQCSAAGYGGACTYRCVADPTSPPGSTPTPTFPPLCGNLTVDPGEACDNYVYNSNTVPNACRLNCQWPICGDSVVDNTNASHGGTNEECDAGAGNSTTGYCSPECYQLPEYNNSCSIIDVDAYAYEGIDLLYSYNASSNVNNPGAYTPSLLITNLRSRFGLDRSAPDRLINDINPGCSGGTCSTDQIVTLSGIETLVNGEAGHSLTLGVNIWSNISGSQYQCESNWYHATPPDSPNENSVNGCNNNCRTTIPIINKVDVACNNFAITDGGVSAGTINQGSILTVTGEVSANFPVNDAKLQYQRVLADNTTTDWTPVPGVTCTASGSVWTCPNVTIADLLQTDQLVRFDLIPLVTLHCSNITNPSDENIADCDNAMFSQSRCRSWGWAAGFPPNDHPDTSCSSSCYVALPVGAVPYTPTPTPTVTLTPIPTNTATPTPIGAPTATPTHTPSPTPTPTSSVPTATPTNTPAVAPAFWGELFYDFNNNGVYETQCAAGHIVEKIDYATFGCTGAGCTDCSPRVALANLIGTLNRSLEGFELLVEGTGYIWPTNPKIRLATNSSNPFYSWNVAPYNSYTLTLTDPRSNVRNCTVTTSNPRTINIFNSTIGNVNTGIICSPPSTPTPTATPTPTITPTPTVTPTPTPGPYWQIQGGNLFSKNGGSNNFLPDLGGAYTYLVANLTSLADSGGAVLHESGNINIGPYPNAFYSENFGDNIVGDTTNSVCTDYTFASFEQSLDTANATSQGSTITGLMPISRFDEIISAADDRGDYTLFYRPLSETLPSGIRLTIGSTWVVPTDTKTIVVVDGDLYVSDISAVEQLIELEPGAFLGFIVSGDIIFESSVGNDVTTITGATNETSNVAGLFFTTDGQIIVQSATLPTKDKRFVGEGTFIGCRGVELQRALQISNNKTEIFRFNPDLVLNVPSDLREAHVSWQEIN